MIAALLCLLSTGCIGAIVVPQVHVTPPLDVGANDVKAIQVKTSWHDGWWGTLESRGPSIWSRDLIEVETSNGRLPSCANSGLCHFLGLCLVGHYRWHEQKLVLYRPGYETVVVPASPWWWPLYAIPQTIHWKEAADDESKRNALWDLEVRIQGNNDPTLREWIIQERMRLSESAN